MTKAGIQLGEPTLRRMEEATTPIHTTTPTIQTSATSDRRLPSHFEGVTYL